MSAYMIFTRQGPIRDSEAMAEYSRRNRESAEEFRNLYGLRPLAVYGAMEAVEGEAPDGVIILEFPTAADARAWYASPAYQAALPYRQKAADYEALIVEGFSA